VSGETSSLDDDSIGLSACYFPLKSVKFVLLMGGMRLLPILHMKARQRYGPPAT
jgi:hypothetical protein